jgi:hypothetical protein
LYFGNSGIEAASAPLRDDCARVEPVRKLIEVNDRLAA